MCQKWYCFGVSNAIRRLTRGSDHTGYWDHVDLGDPPPMKLIEPYVSCKEGHSLCPSEQKGESYLYKALVVVVMHMPYKIEGFPKTKRQGAGLILDSSNGFVLVSRSVVPHSFGSILITFAEIVDLPAKPIFFHPTHNYAIIKYDPSLIDPRLVSQVELCEDEIAHGESVNLIGLKCNLRPVFVSTTVTDMSPMFVPYFSTPRYRAINFNGIHVDTLIAQQCLTGFLANSEGKAKAVCLSFLREIKKVKSDVEYLVGIESRCVIPVLRRLQSGGSPNLRGFPAEFIPLQLCQAQNMGLSYDRIRQIEKLGDDRTHIFMINRTEHADDKSEDQLQITDLILCIDGEMITQISQLELSLDWKDEVDMIVLRNRCEVRLKISTKNFKYEDTDRVLIWSGAVIHEPHQSVLMQTKTLPSRVIVMHRAKGSPAYMYGIVPTQFIIAVGGKSVRDIDDFIKATKDLADEAYVRVKTVGFDLVPSMISVKLFNHYWPPTEFVRDKDSQFGWVEVKNQVV